MTRVNIKFLQTLNVYFNIIEKTITGDLWSVIVQYGQSLLHKSASKQQQRTGKTHPSLFPYIHDIIQNPGGQADSDSDSTVGPGDSPNWADRTP